MNIKELQGISTELLSYLSVKSRKVLIKRFGLHNKKPQTLESIGKEFGITRERVRQIEAASFKALKKKKKTEAIITIINDIKNKIDEKGGYIDEETLEKIIIKNKCLSLLQKNQLKLILNSCADIYYHKFGIKFNNVWYLKGKKEAMMKLQKIHEMLVKYFKENKKIMTFKQIFEVVSGKNFHEISKDVFINKYGKERLKILLKGSKIINNNLINQWGLKSWKLISQKGSRERAYLIYRKYKKPLHFTDLTKYINKEFKNQKKSLPQTVYNTVIMYDEFIPVESGVYALREWGIFDDYIQKEIINFLEKQNQFVTLDKIIEFIASKKEINDLTIQVILYDRELFVRKQNKYALKKRFV